MKKIFIYSFCVLMFAGSGCKKFMDVTPKGLFLPKTVADYELFMNDVLIADAAYGYEEFMTDDIAYTDDILVSQLNYRNGRSYLWQADLFKVTEDDGEWNNMYRNIYNCNLVLKNIGDATGGTPADKERIIAEAKIHRAYYYFHLANLFGNDYQEATAAKDLAVPLLLVPDLEAKTSRATVKEVYEQVLKDLSDAIALNGLPDMGSNYVHPGKAAALALQARVYLYMGDYSKAMKAATDALVLHNTLLDYNTFSLVNPARPYSGVNGRPTVDKNPENIYTKTNSNNGIITRFMIHPDLLQILGETDLRYVYTFTRLTRTGAVSTNPYPDYFANTVNYSIGVPEMMLIKAECLARDQETGEAVKILNELRKKRFKPGDYSDVSAATADEALGLVLEERRRELMYHGLRWFDLKRLNRDERFKKTLTREYDGTVYTLAPQDPKYLLQIAPKIVQINPAIIPNPR